MRQTVTLLGVPFEPLSKEEAEERICALLEQTAQARLYTPNPAMLWQAKCDPAFRRLLSEADILLPDGVGVTLAARLKGTPLPARLPGIDMAEITLAHAARQGATVFLLGGRPGVAEAAKAALLVRFPALKIVGTHHGYFDKRMGSTEDQAVLSLLRQTAPHLLAVCFGSPAQEQWIASHAPLLPSLRLAMGLGGSLDVWAGVLPRAPRLLRRLGAEWAWRTLLEPRRMRTLLTLPPFLFAALAERK